MSAPAITEYAPFYATYVKLVPEDDILAALADECARTAEFLAGIPADTERICHPPYTWTVRQVVGHILDAERVFAYRALRFARGDGTALPGFDEGGFAANAPHAKIPLADLRTEYLHVRAATLHLFKPLDPAAWMRRGIASGAEVTVRAMAYIVVGHERHHMGILRRRWATA